MNEDTTQINNADEAARQAVQRLFLQNSVEIHGYLMSMVPFNADLDDLFQETFVSAIKYAASYDPSTPFRPWVYTLARYCVLSWVRDHQRDRHRALSEEVIQKLSDEMPRDRSYEGVMQALEHCLPRLSPSNRKLLRLHYLDGLKCDDIAQRLQVRLQSVYNGLNRARAQLRRCVESWKQRTARYQQP